MNKNLNKRGASKKKGAAYVSEELTEDGPAIDVADKGIARKKGAAASYDKDMAHEWELISDAKGAIHSEDEAKKAHEGTGRMGFTQNFGPARQNSYAKGAAKVNSIMNYGGAAKAKGAAEYGGKKGDESKSHLDYEE